MSIFARITRGQDEIHSALLVFIPLVILMFRKKDGGISVVAKKRSAIGTFF
jgi:hypothetical protein